MPPEKLLSADYAAFNARRWDDFLALLSADVVHDLGQGRREIGLAAFASFMQRMNHCCAEQIEDRVIMVHAEGSRAAAEYTVVGRYLVTDEGLPAASGRVYRLPGGAFFDIRDGKVARVSNCYKLQDWLQQVGAA